MWGEMAGIGGHLGSGVEVWYSGNFLECMKVILMKIPSKGRYGVSTVLLCVRFESRAFHIPGK